MQSTFVKPRIKNIDINPHTFRTLSIRAAEKGTNLKNYIESILDSKAEEEEDLLLYSLCVKNNPECWEFLSPEEKASFEIEFGL